MTSIAIDGPSGVGKSTLARAAAKKLGYIYIDTGAFYRAVALFMLRNGVDVNDPDMVERLLPRVCLEIAYLSGEQRIFLNGEDVSESIRTPEVTRAVSPVSAIGSVRKHMVAQQQELARNVDVIMDGRDIGTVVLPDAAYKIFLTARDEVRAERRYKEYIANGQSVSYDEVLKDIRARDYYDSNREITPLRAAEDSIILDTSDMNFEQVLSHLLLIAKGN